MATVVEVSSKAKSKWRPQALDTVVCSGGIKRVLTLFLRPGFCCGLWPRDITLHRATQESTWEKQKLQNMALLGLRALFLFKLLVEWNCFMWILRNKKRKINHLSPHHPCTITDTIFLFFHMLIFLQSCNSNSGGGFFPAKLFLLIFLRNLCKHLNICFMSPP